MTFQVKFSAQATKFFRKFPPDIQNRIKKKFLDIAKDPSRYLEHYEGDYDKIRIGKLRALVDVDYSERIIWVRVFDKRGRIYK